MQIRILPTAEQILAGLTAIANEWLLLAALWHAYLLMLVVVLWQVRPARVFAILLTLPLFSVSALAWSEDNPFNGAIFLVGALALIALAAQLPRTPTFVAPRWAIVAGAALLIFGWIYPHFLEAPTVFAYLYVAPMGLLPCPTLSAVVGLTLAAGGFSRAWSLVLASLAAFYGVFGAFILGVHIDLSLTAGAILLLVLALQRMERVGARAA